MKTKKEIMDHLLAKKLPKPVSKTLMWVLDNSVDEEFCKQVAKKQKQAQARSKGSGFENAVAKRLSLWWTDGEDDKYIRRVPLSGGYDKTSISGDVFCPSNPVEFPFSIECKSQEAWNMFQLLDGKGAPMGWWQQCIRDEECGRYKREPVLIFTAKQRPTFWMMTLQTLFRLDSTGNWGILDGLSRYADQRNIYERYVIINTESINAISGPVILLHFEDALKYITPERAKNLKVDKR